MIGINREITNLSEEYVYCLIDSINLRVNEEEFRTVKNKDDISHTMLVTSFEKKYIFGGKKHQTDKRKYLGFETSDNELKNYNNNLFDIFESHLEFNYGLDKTNIN